MSKEMDASIARAIANIAIFLEFSADEILKAMEQLAADLQSLDEGAQNTTVSCDLVNCARISRER